MRYKIWPPFYILNFLLPHLTLHKPTAASDLTGLNDLVTLSVDDAFLGEERQRTQRTQAGSSRSLQTWCCVGLKILPLHSFTRFSEVQRWETLLGDDVRS